MSASGMAAGKPATIRLADLDAPLERVELPSGRVAQVVEFDLAGYDALRAFREAPDDAVLFGLVRRAIPDLTDAELGHLRPMHCLAIVAVAAGRADTLVAQLRTAVGDDEAPTDTTEGNAEPVRTGRPRRRRARVTPSTSIPSARSPFASPAASGEIC